MKKLFDAIDNSLENDDANWFELYDNMDFSYEVKITVMAYIKHYFRDKGNDIAKSNETAITFLRKADKAILEFIWSEDPNLGTQNETN